MAESQKSMTEAQPRPDPNEKLVKVFESEEETEALVVKGLLESASIESDVAPLDCRVPPKNSRTLTKKQKRTLPKNRQRQCDGAPVEKKRHRSIAPSHIHPVDVRPQLDRRSRTSLPSTIFLLLAIRSKIVTTE